MESFEIAMPIAEQILLIAWAFLVGGVIGSFLNVVVYRVPREISLVSPPSHCPNCKHPIRWYDNVPIVAWLVLRGKCRDCGEPISPRYPLVELVAATMFAALMTVEFVFEGMYLPQRDGAPAWNQISDQLFLILLYHLALLGVLLCGALIEFDRQRPPTRMYMMTILAGLIFPLQWTLLHPVKAWADEPLLFSSGIDGLAGLAAGGVLGFVLWQLTGRKQPGGLPLGLACVGVFLGWQAVLPIFAATAMLGGLTAVASHKRQGPLVPASAWLWVLTFSWVLFWSPLAHWVNLP